MDDFEVEERLRALPQDDYVTLVELASALSENRPPRWVRIARRYRRKLLRAWMEEKEQGGTKL